MYLFNNEIILSPPLFSMLYFGMSEVGVARYLTDTGIKEKYQILSIGDNSSDTIPAYIVHNLLNKE